MLKKVKSGDPLSRSLRRTGPLKIPAATLNAFIDAARDFRARTQNRAQKAKPAVRQSGIVLVRNTTAVDLLQDPVTQRVVNSPSMPWNRSLCIT